MRIKGFLGDTNEAFRIFPIGERHLSFCPQLGEVMPPGLLQSVEKEIGPAQQEHFRHRRIALGERRQVLIHDRFEETRDDLLNGDAGLDQGICIRFGKDAALRAHLVKRIARVPHLDELVDDAQLPGGFFNEIASPSGAGGLHHHLFRFPIPEHLREEDRLHVFPADLRDKHDLGMELLHGCRDRDDFLDMLRADELDDGSTG